MCRIVTICALLCCLRRAPHLVPTTVCLVPAASCFTSCTMSSFLISLNPAHVVFSQELQQSRISSNLVKKHASQKSNWPEYTASVTVSQHSMPLTCFTTVIDFVVDPFLTHYDAILGIDWSFECRHIGMPQLPEMVDTNNDRILRTRRY